MLQTKAAYLVAQQTNKPAVRYQPQAQEKTTMQQQHNAVVLAINQMTRDIVVLPSAQHARDPEKPGRGYSPGGTFIGVSTPEIRHRNLQRYRSTQSRYKHRLEQEVFLSNAVAAALATAQAGSLVEEKYR